MLSRLRERMLDHAIFFIDPFFLPFLSVIDGLKVIGQKRKKKINPEIPKKLCFFIFIVF